jgi:membrane-bound lytic murein transglycosylase D
MKMMSLRNLSKLMLAICLASLTVTAVEAAESPFVRTPEIEPDIRFWTRVYTEVTTNGGLVHDERNLGIVYEVISFPETLSPAQRSKRVDEAKDKYRAILKRLASGNTGGSPEETRVRELWPENTSMRAFGEASEHVRFQLGQADRFKAGLVRSGAYEAHIAETLANMGLPAEIAALPHVESSFDPTAYSKAGAAGLWQFMRSTGRRFMRIDSTVDERMDPYRATVAAAQLLQFNYDLLGTWPLAITAYNHGAAGMRRAKEKQGTSDIVTIIRKHQSRTFGFASRNYYVAFLAALDVDRDAEKYFGSLTRNSEVKSHTFGVPDYVPVAAMQRVLDVDMEMLRTLNPSLTAAVWNGERYIPRGFVLRVPDGVGTTSEWQTRMAALQPAERFDQQKMDRIYRVRRGDTLSAIASSHGTSVATLMRLNDLRTANQVRHGQVLQLPGTEPRPVVVAATLAVPSTSAAAPAATTMAPAQPPVAPSEAYVVRRGDSLSNIARDAGLTERELMALNGIKNRNFIYEGQKLRLASTAGEKLPQGTVTITDMTPQPALADIEAQPEEEPQSEREIALAQAAEPVSASQAEELGPNLVSGAETSAMSADPSDYTVADDGTIEVQAAETLGHYADWLGIRASRLRELNHMRFGTPVVIGQRLKIDTSSTSADQFEQRRRSYHQRLQEDFFAANRIVGTEVHVVRRGESLWLIAQKYPNLPIWLLRQYNPDVNFDDVRPRTQLVMPLIQSAGAQPAGAMQPAGGVSS